MSTLQQLIDTYNENDPTHELEYGMHFNNPKIFELVFGKFLEEQTPEYEQSLVVITNRERNADGGYISDRTVMNFKKNKVHETIYQRKTRIGCVNFSTKYLNYSLTLASEQDIEKFSNNAASVVILRTRARFYQGDWKYEFTIAREFNASETNQIKGFKKTMIGNMNDDKFSDLMDKDNMKLSLEIEHDPDPDNLDVREKPSRDDLENIANDIFKIIDPEYEKSLELQENIYELASFLRPNDKAEFKRRGLKSLLPQAKTLTKNLYLDKVYPNIEQFYVSGKADGERCIAMITNTSCQIITAQKVITVNVQSEDEGVTIIDAELMYETVGKGNKQKEVPRIIPIDLPYIRTKDMKNEGFELRQDEFDAARELLGPFVGPKKPFKRLKKSNFGSTLKKLVEHKWDFKMDGIIFVKTEQPYNQTDVYKWKPENTIDFLVRRVPRSLQGKAPFQIKPGFTPYILFCGINYHRFRDSKLSKIPSYETLFPPTSRRMTYFPIQFSPPDFPRAYIYYHEGEDDLDNRIIEFTYVIPDGGSVIEGHWEIKRIRDDRQIELQHGNYFGNDYDVALTNWSNLSNPITLEFLCDPTLDVYFKQPKPTRYNGLSKFVHYIKKRLFKQLNNNTWVIDLGSGKGQDLFNYTGKNIQNIVFIDNDPTALEELKERTQNTEMKGGIDMRIMTHVADLTQPYVQTLKELLEFQIPASGVEGVVCNFAIHYLMTSAEQLDNFIKLVNRILRPGGRFIFTVLDGLRVHELFERKKLVRNESFNLEDDDGNLKYSIRRLYASKKLNHYKNKVEVMLPFTQGEYYPEMLVDIEHVIQQFEKKDFEREQYCSFGEQLNQFKQHRPNDYAALGTDDLEFAQLYSMVTLYKLDKKRR
jgi:SAM-dependent methyltransferase